MERICPSCGEKVTDDRARFCPICATALPEKAEVSIPALEEALLGSYQDYIAWVVLTRSKEGTGKRFLETLLGNSAFKNNAQHEEYYHVMEQRSAALREAYQAMPGVGDVAATLRYVLIDCHADAGIDADWLLVVAEQLYVDFPALLSPAEAAALYTDYKALLKKQGEFPFQKQMLKALKQRSRG